MQQAVCVRRNKKKGENKTTISAPRETHHKVHNSSVTAISSGRREVKHAPFVSPYTPAPIDPVLMEIGHAQLSQTSKKTNVTHAHRREDRQTDKSNDGTLYAPRYEEFFALQAKNGLGRFALSALSHY